MYRLHDFYTGILKFLSKLSRFSVYFKLNHPVVDAKFIFLLATKIILFSHRELLKCIQTIEMLGQG